MKNIIIIIWASQYKKDMDTLECDSSEGSQRLFKRLEHLSYRERLGELRLFIQGKGRFKGHLINVCKCLMAWCEEDSARFVSVAPSGMVTGSRHKLKYRKSDLNIRNFFYCQGGHTLEQVAQMICGVSVLGDIQYPTEHDAFNLQ